MVAEAEARAEAARGAEELAALRRELVRERGAAAAAATTAEGQERALRGEVVSLQRLALEDSSRLASSHHAELAAARQEVRSLVITPSRAGGRTAGG